MVGRRRRGARAQLASLLEGAQDAADQRDRADDPLPAEQDRTFRFPPARILVAEGENRLNLRPRPGGTGVGMGPMGAILQTGAPAVVEALLPAVAGATTAAVMAAGQADVLPVGGMPAESAVALLGRGREGARRAGASDPVESAFEPVTWMEWAAGLRQVMAAAQRVDCDTRTPPECGWVRSPPPPGMAPLLCARPPGLAPRAMPGNDTVNCRPSC